MESAKGYRRTRTVVDAKFQLHYMAIWFVVTAALILVCGTFYLWERAKQGKNIFPQISESLDKLLLGNAIFLLLLALLMGLYALLHSHKIAGPLRRITNSIGKLLVDDYSVQVGVRKGDYFQEFAGILNTVVSRLKEKEEKLKQARKEVDDIATLLNKDGSSGEVKEKFEKVRTLLLATRPLIEIEPEPPAV
jgi:methyl-accepting chemotaxis protein